MKENTLRYFFSRKCLEAITGEKIETLDFDKKLKKFILKKNKKSEGSADINQAY